MRNISQLPYMDMFVKKRKKRGTMWASLFGLGLSAVLFGITRRRRSEIALPFQQVMKNFSPKNTFNGMNQVALTEFSDELLASALKNDKDRNEKSPL